MILRGVCHADTDGPLSDLRAAISKVRAIISTQFWVLVGMPKNAGRSSRVVGAHGPAARSEPLVQESRMPAESPANDGSDLFGSLSRAGFAVAWMERTGTTVSLSPELARMLGQHLCVLPVASLLESGRLRGSDGRPLLWEEFPLVRALTIGAPTNHHVLLQRVREVARWLTWQATPLHDQHGTPTGALAIVVETTRPLRSASPAHGDDHRTGVEPGGDPTSVGTSIADLMHHVELLVYQRHQLPAAAQASVRALQQQAHRLQAQLSPQPSTSLPTAREAESP